MLRLLLQPAQSAVQAYFARSVVHKVEKTTGERYEEIYLIFADPDFTTPSAVRMAEILREDASRLRLVAA